MNKKETVINLELDTQEIALILRALEWQYIGIKEIARKCMESRKYYLYTELVKEAREFGDIKDKIIMEGCDE